MSTLSKNQERMVLTILLQTLDDLSTLFQPPNRMDRRMPATVLEHSGLWESQKPIQSRLGRP
jgi:hypothetical protein